MGKGKQQEEERGEKKKPHTKRDSRRREVHKDVSGLGEEEIRGEQQHWQEWHGWTLVSWMWSQNAEEHCVLKIYKK